MAKSAAKRSIWKKRSTVAFKKQKAAKRSHSIDDILAEGAKRFDGTLTRLAKK